MCHFRLYSMSRVRLTTFHGQNNLASKEIVLSLGLANHLALTRGKKWYAVHQSATLAIRYSMCNLSETRVIPS